MIKAGFKLSQENAQLGKLSTDNKLSNLQRGDLIVIAGCSSMGKTTFAFNIAENLAMKQGLPAMFIPCLTRRESLR